MIPTGYTLIPLQANYRRWLNTNLMVSFQKTSLRFSYGRTEEKVCHGRIQSSLAYLRANNEPKTSEEHFLILAQLWQRRRRKKPKASKLLCGFGKRPLLLVEELKKYV